MADTFFPKLALISIQNVGTNMAAIFLKIGKICMKLVTPGFSSWLTMNLRTDYQNSKWRILFSKIVLNFYC